MVARIVLLLTALLSTTSTHAALWQVENINTGDVFATFSHNPGGLNPGPVPFFENILLYWSIDGSADAFFAPTAASGLLNDDAHLTSVSVENPQYLHFVMDFAAPLTAAGGIVGVNYWGIAPDGNFCRGDGFCIEEGPGTYVARSVAAFSVSQPNTTLLMLAAFGALVVLRSSQQRRYGKQRSALV